jgi:hypothetical protein
MRYAGREPGKWQVDEGVSRRVTHAVLLLLLWLVNAVIVHPQRLRIQT